ncbi:snf2 histone linker phd ring helicase [Dorcoceras hygrometricum]|uniref:Snf2 histone linker phd ring helicase n=1 Tax=Dorcoceras hygrometricum TaxID=472368 RepID=A0A2Z7D075_9LAMI|nr:snf2 histone linker phd ring helicase [Dorcoceras hygrometricum]
MGRRKQVRPHRTVGVLERNTDEVSLNDEGPDLEKDDLVDGNEPFFVEMDRSSWVSEEHYDVSEIILLNLRVSEVFYDYTVSEDICQDSRHFLRFRLSDVNEHLSRIKLGHWPVLCAGSIYLEFVMRCVADGLERDVVIVSGNVDGPDEGVTSLVHLVSLKLLTVRPNLGTRFLKDMMSMCVRVEILKRVFNECESLLDNTRPLWKKSMMSVMNWLRPEVLTSESRYGSNAISRMDDEVPIGIDYDSSEAKEQAKFEVSDFYEAIKPSKEAPMLDYHLPELLPELRPYQSRAAYWMVQRENSDRGCLGRSEKRQIVTPLSMPLNLIDTSRRIYYNPFSGNISLHPFCFSSHISGGILADEMGLGKTVELLACMLAHRMPSVEVTDGAYKMMQVHGSPETLTQATESPVETAATLVVCPTPILHQWHGEILRHTKPGSLKVCVYEGVRYTSFSDKPAIDIEELLSADIVLTTYDVLKTDLPHDSERHEGDRRFMRYKKRYPVAPTHLTRILWWRICLDEAQMVEGNAAATSELALRLHAKNRWCITGTPIQRKLDDLFGLLRFLQANPFDTYKWWTDVICNPYERGDAEAMVFTHNFFKPLMWRSSKTSVWDELELPPQEEHVTWLSLSPIEQHFYQRQHKTCVDDAQEVIESFKYHVRKGKEADALACDALSETFITNVEAAKLFNSLLKLRQACCHPQVGSSGLRSLQKSPMTMEEILSVLIGKTKVEGEDALRKLVVAVNGLAGIAMIKQDYKEAVSLYKEALFMVQEHSDDFRLDPLLNIHIHHNLSEILSLSVDSLTDTSVSRRSEELTGPCDIDKNQNNAVIKERLVRHDHSLTSENTPHTSSCLFLHSENCYDAQPHLSTNIQHLRTACEDLKQKYLSVFYARLSTAQQEFRKSHEQLCDAFRGRKNQDSTWWLDALYDIEQNKELANELMRKIGGALSAGAYKKSRSSAWFRSITTVKYHIQTGLDALEESRKTLLNKLLEIDETMENPREEDIIRVRYCALCYPDFDGPACTHCELDEIFQVYEARLFRPNKSKNGESIISVEEAVNLQKKTSSLNHFYWTLSRPNKASSLSASGSEDNGKKRDVGEKVMVSRSPSDLEVVMTIIKNNFRAFLGRETISAAKKQLNLLEGMRKEYALARSLAISQAQVLRAHDEIKMATSRLRLKANEDDKSVDALSPGELDIASDENSSEKFLALASLSRIKGQLRFLKGLVQSKRSTCSESVDTSTVSEAAVILENGSLAKADDEESCPVCQEKLGNQKMVFQCGHVTCCKCFFAMTDQGLIQDRKFYNNKVRCPTCRQPTDFGNIAYADDQHNDNCGGCDKSEASVTVQGSYSTKIEGVTRRILWIISTDPTVKILVFSSWNDVLDVLQHAFTTNSISYIRMKGGRKSQVAISEFKGQRSHGKENNKKIHEGTMTKSAPAQVLLLLIQHGSNGLNLLEAQHVILVEPLLNPASEAQAVGRVHRIGQKNKTLVHRFIVKDTVEESIYKLNQSRNTSSFLSGNRKNLDQPRLTLRDVESLFRVSAPAAVAEDQMPARSLRDLPPSVAAAIAAEWRIMDGAT